MCHEKQSSIKDFKKLNWIWNQVYSSAVALSMPFSFSDSGSFLQEIKSGKIYVAHWMLMKIVRHLFNDKSLELKRKV